MEILSLGEKIKRRRKELNMTLKDLAGTRITPGQISLVESGRSNPSMDLLEYLAGALKSSVEYLMESEETQAEKICIYYEQIAESYILNSEFILGEEYIEKALYYAEKFDLEYQKALNLYLRSKICMEKNELALAQQLLLSANVIFIKNNSYNEMAKSFLYLGKITAQLRAFHSTISYLRQAEKIYIDNNLGDDFMLGEIYFQMAEAYYKLEDNKSAMDYSFLAREKFDQIHNREKYAKTLLQISEEYNKKGDLLNAIKYSKKTLEVYKELQEEKKVSGIENSLGKLFYHFDNIEESFKHFEIAKDIRIRTNDSSVIETMMNICENYIKIKSVENCEKVLAQLSDLIQEDDVDMIIRKNLLWARVYSLKEMYDEIERILIETFKYSKANGASENTAKLAIMLGKYYIDFKKDSEAAKYLDEGVNIFKELGLLNN